MPTTPTQAEIIRRAIQARLDEVHTAMPCRVISYDSARETVDVAPQFQRALENDPASAEPFTFEDLPNIPDVPIAWPGGSGGFFTFPMTKGDTGLLVFTERDLGMWRDTGEVGTPGDQRTHGLAGAVFYPGLRPNGELLGASKVGTGVTIGGEVMMGAATAVQALLKGTLFNTDLATLMSALSIWAVATNVVIQATGAPPAAKATYATATTTFTTAITTFLAAQPAHLSTKHKLDG